MNKTLNINLAGLIFHIDEDAYNRLERYLGAIKRQFRNTEGGEEIISDIESRIAELFREKTSVGKEVIGIEDVDSVISVMGKPEDYVYSDDDEQETKSSQYTYNPKAEKRVFRDPDDRVLGGVASGLGAYFSIDPVWLRILFVVLFFGGFGFLLYLILWLVIPKANTTAEKLQMRGESVTVSNIEKSIKEEMSNLNKNVKDFASKAKNYDYQKPVKKAGGFMHDFGNFIVDAVRMIFKFVFKFIGFIFLFIGFMVLLGIVIALFTGGVQIMGSGYGFSELYDFMELVTIDNAHMNLLVFGTVLLAVSPLFLLTYLGIRILFNLSPLNGSVKGSLALLAFIGFIFVLISGIKIGLEFDDRFRQKSEVAVEDHDILHLEILQDSVYHDLEDLGYEAHWINYNGRNVFEKVELDIRRSTDSTNYVEIISYAKGNSRRTARANAQALRYSFSQMDSLIQFPTYYSLEKGEKFRDQEIRLILYIKDGQRVYLEPGMEDIIYNVSNIQHYWDPDMIDHEWVMTPEGLNCADCPESTRRSSHGSASIEIQDEDGTEIEFEADENSLKIRIDSDPDPEVEEEEFDEEGIEEDTTDLEVSLHSGGLWDQTKEAVSPEKYIAPLLGRIKVAI